MKITRVTIRNYVGAKEVDAHIKAPVVLFAGHNGAGKTSVAEAVRAAMMGSLERVNRKMDLPLLVTKGSGKTGTVAIDTDVGKASFEIPSGSWGAQLDLAGQGSFLPLVLWPEKLPLMDDTARRRWLFTLARIDLKPTVVFERLERRGCNMTLVRKLDMAAGLEAASKAAANEATLSKGAWGKITGNRWGPKAGEEWKIEVPPFDMDAWDELQASIISAQNLRNEAMRRVGVLEGRREAQAEARNRLEGLRALVRRLPEMETEYRALQDQADEASEALVGLGKAQTAAKEALEAAKAAAKGGERTPAPTMLVEARHILGDALRVVVSTEGASSKGSLLPWDSQTWVSAAARWTDRYDSQYPAKPGKPVPAEIQKAFDDAQTAMSQANQRSLDADEAVRVAREQIGTARQAALDLEKPQEEPVSVGDIQEAEATAKRSADSLTGLLEAQEERAEAHRKTEEAATKNLEAAAEHAKVVQWDAIAKALAPDGIPGEILAEALGPMNAVLREIAELSNWSQVAIAADMAITVGGFDYALCSESEKWRACAAIGIAVAKLSGLKFVMLDRCDVLDVNNRVELVGTIHDLVEAGTLEGACLFGTFASKPTGLPESFQVVWLESGRVGS